MISMTDTIIWFSPSMFVITGQRISLESFMHCRPIDGASLLISSPAYFETTSISTVVQSHCWRPFWVSTSSAEGFTEVEDSYTLMLLDDISFVLAYWRIQLKWSALEKISGNKTVTGGMLGGLMSEIIRVTRTFFYKLPKVVWRRHVVNDLQAIPVTTKFSNLIARPKVSDWFYISIFPVLPPAR